MLTGSTSETIFGIKKFTDDAIAIIIRKITTLLIIKFNDIL